MLARLRQMMTASEAHHRRSGASPIRSNLNPNAIAWWLRSGLTGAWLFQLGGCQTVCRLIGRCNRSAEVWLLAGRLRLSAEGGLSVGPLSRLSSNRLGLLFSVMTDREFGEAKQGTGGSLLEQSAYGSTYSTTAN
jgi:hypothetical protein